MPDYVEYIRPPWALELNFNVAAGTGRNGQAQSVLLHGANPAR